MTTTESTTPVLGSTDDALATVSALAADIVVGAVERELTSKWPEQELRRIGESGLLGILVPADHGGPTCRDPRRSRFFASFRGQTRASASCCSRTTC